MVHSTVAPMPSAARAPMPGSAGSRPSSQTMCASSSSGRATNISEMRPGLRSRRCRRRSPEGVGEAAGLVAARSRTGLAGFPVQVRNMNDESVVSTPVLARSFFALGHAGIYRNGGGRAARTVGQAGLAPERWSGPTTPDRAAGAGSLRLLEWPRWAPPRSGRQPRCPSAR